LSTGRELFSHFSRMQDAGRGEGREGVRNPWKTPEKFALMRSNQIGDLDAHGRAGDNRAGTRPIQERSRIAIHGKKAALGARKQ